MAYIGQAPANKPVSASDLEDGLITNSKLAQDIISGETELATAPADTDELLISDAGVLKRIDASLIGGGKLLQVSQDSLTSQASTTSTSFVATGLDIDFTPSASSSKVLVSFMLNNYAISSNTQTRVTIYRDSTNLGHSTYGLLEGYTNVHHGYPLGMSFLDTPNTSSQIHYEIYVNTNSGTLHYGGNGSYAMTDYIQCFEIGA